MSGIQGKQPPLIGFIGLSKKLFSFSLHFEGTTQSVHIYLCFPLKGPPSYWGAGSPGSATKYATTDLQTLAILTLVMSWLKPWKQTSPPTVLWNTV
jgi:hypothetical protein